MDRIRRLASHAPLLALLLCAPVGSGCGDDATGGNQNNTNADTDAALGDGQVPDDGTIRPDGDTTPPTALLELYALDIWAQPLPQTEGTLTVTRNGQPVTVAGYPVGTVGLYDAGDYEVTLAAPEHETLQLTVSWDGSATLTGASVTPEAGAPAHGISVSHEDRNVSGSEVVVHTVYLGLRHKWFSAQGRSARRGNSIDLLMDGEEAWGTVYPDLTAAIDTVMIATWWWDSEFELLRDWSTHHLLTPAQRWQNTMLGILEDSHAHHRLLIGEFWGSHSILDWLTSDSALQGYAETPNDDFEIMGQGNETYGVFWFEVDPFQFGERVRSTHTEAASRVFETEDDIESTVPAREVDLTWWPISVELQIASYHQKFLVVDQEIAFVGGMNIKAVDWDSNDHLVYDHRRMEYDATQSAREDVMSKDELPDNGPRKDYMMRIEGPSVQDVAEIFEQRWSYQIAQGAEFSANSTNFVVARDQPVQPGGSQIQITPTLPEPFWEHAIAETWFNAVAQAEEYIFVEDQYWRVPMLVDAIIARMNQVPNLRLLVVTKPVSDWSDPGCPWTSITHADLQAAFPNRYATYQLRAFDTRLDDAWPWNEDETEGVYQDMDVHSKMLIVDDKFMSVGSCNKNNRGIVYEGELNVAILDPAWVRQQRRRIFANMLPAGVPATDDVATWWTQFSDAAAWNDTVHQAWVDEGDYIDLGDDSNPGPLPANYTPQGFIHSLDFVDVSDCFIEDVGPDMT
ncbi:MAG: phospholipase D-like domain-containing protein [bacterium]